MKKQAVVLLGHGSKSKDAIEDFSFVVNGVSKKMQDFEVFGAHMEIAQPSLEDVIAEIASQKSEKVIIIPYFLFQGNHIKFDIPKKIDNLQKLYPNLKFSFGTPIGKDPLMAEIMAKKVEALVQ